MKFGPQPLREQARRAVADRLPIDPHDRHDDVGGRRDERLARTPRLLDRKRPFDELDGLALQHIDQRGARDAAQDGVVDLARDEPALLVDDPGVR